MTIKEFADEMPLLNVCDTEGETLAIGLLETHPKEAVERISGCCDASM